MREKEEILKDINEALQLIRPYLQADGGDVSLVDMDANYIVKIKLLGACGNCPMSLQTLKNGVEQTIKHSVPEVKSVISDEVREDIYS